ncbi:MAG TPA: hypothetical protein VHW01_23095, partial [Polyangiaceae bacterium]|nr:hypothetical protein [Polyangiaceae bacterium]
MRFGAVKWGVLGVSSLVGAFSCSGKDLNEVGDLNSGGTGGSSVGGLQSSGGTVDDRAGRDGTGTAGLVAQGGVAGGEVGLPPDLQAGAPGAAGQPEYGCANCGLVVDRQDIRGAAANDQKVYWTDYGTKDKLGNYQTNGRLLARGLDGGALSVVADSLAGPEAVGLSAGYAYIALDQRDETDFPSGVIRVPLAGGAPQPVQSLAQGYAPPGFFTTPDYEYWSSAGGVSRIAATDGAQVESFYPSDGVGEIFGVDDTQLYVFAEVSAGSIGFGTTSSIWTLALTGGGVKNKLANYPGGLLDLQGDYIYGVESLDGGANYLTRMPKAGGAWRRVAEAHNGTTWQNIAVEGDHYLVDEQTDDLRWIFSS